MTADAQTLVGWNVHVELTTPGLTEWRWCRATSPQEAANYLLRTSHDVAAVINVERAT